MKENLEFNEDAARVMREAIKARGVTVELDDATLAAIWQSLCFEFGLFSMAERAGAWGSVVDEMNKHNPKWYNMEGTGVESMCKSIAQLAKQGERDGLLRAATLLWDGAAQLREEAGVISSGGEVGVVSEGWKLVPLAPTDHMEFAGLNSTSVHLRKAEARAVYMAMVEEAPQYGASKTGDDQ